MYTIKLCLGLPSDDVSDTISRYNRHLTLWKMLDLGISFPDYQSANKYAERLGFINGTENSAIDFWVSVSENTQS